MTGDELRAWRRERGMTQAQAAKWFGCDRRTWQRMETEEYRIPAALLRRLEIAVGFDDAVDASFGA